MKRAAIFPGQGAQKPGMGRDLRDRFPLARELFDRADAALDFPLARTCFEGPEETVNRTDVCQPGIFLVSAATMEVLRDLGALGRADFAAAAGLSLGEYTALWFAGALSFEDGLRLTRLRGRLMQEASDARPSGMTSLLGLDREPVEEACAAVRADGGIVCVANLNAPGQVVISGALEDVARAAELAKAAGARRAIPLAVAGAFHSPLMASAAEGLAAELERTEVRPCAVPVVSNVTGRAMTEPAEIRANLVAQLTSPVLWADSMRLLLGEGFGEFVEPAPGTVLAGLMKKIDRDAGVRGFPDADSVEGARP